MLHSTNEGRVFFQNPPRSGAAMGPSLIRDVLVSLPPGERLALVLHHWERLDPAGISDALRISSSDAERLLRRGNAAVSRALRRRGGGGDGRRANADAA